AGTDGKDVGISDWTTFSNLTSGVRSQVNYTPASITTASPLPNGTNGVAYTQQLSATSASDFQYWRLTSGALCAGLGLSNSGLISGTPTSTGTCSFTVQLMDAAQQYATRAFSLTIASGGGGVGSTWMPVNT